MATPKRVLRAIEKRDGKVCVWHGLSCGEDVLVPQHRQGGMGGSRFKHRLSNVLWLCSHINGLIEDNADAADDARKLGIKVPFWDDTTEVPVTYPDGIKYLLDDFGGRRAEHETGNE